MLRKHTRDDQPCTGSDRPAVGEMPELHVTRPSAVDQRVADAHIASVA